MDFQKLKDMFNNGEISFEQLEGLIGETSFSEASKLGLDYAKGMKYVSFENAPFCLDRVKAAPVKVVLSESVKPIIEDMKTSAKEQSDKRGKSAENYEASFCLYGRIVGDKIIISDAFWDERGYKPNEYKYADPDSLNYASFFDNYSNVTTTSRGYDKQVDGVCASATSDGSLVVIYGHTHPQTNTYGKINNYPSRSDIVLSVEEAVTHYAQENGNCTFLNAIINADGDLNIFGYDVEAGKFFTIHDVKYETGEKVASYTEGNYPIQAGPIGPSSN